MVNERCVVNLHPRRGLPERGGSRGPGCLKDAQP